MNIKVKRILTKIFDKSIKTTWFFRFMVSLSGIFGLYYTIFNLLALVMKDKVIDFIQSSSFPETIYFYKQNLIFFFSGNRIMYFICFLAGLCMLNAFQLLFRGFKWGLLFYTIAKLIQVVIPISFMGFRMLSIGDAMLILLFMVYYYVYSFSHQIDKKDRKYNQIGLSDNKIQ